MKPSEKYKDNANGVITDISSKKAWLPKDAWVDLGKWVDWEGALGYARLMNTVYAGGFSDWRLPTKEEALSFYEPELQQMDWEDKVVHIHPLFVGKCSYLMWTNDVDQDGKAFCLNIRDGVGDFIDKSKKENHGARLVRDMK